MRSLERRVLVPLAVLIVPLSRAAAQGWIEPIRPVPRGAVEKVRSAIQVALTGRVARVTVEEWFIRGIYRARMIGYSTIVVVEQALDSSAAIAVINGRPSSVMVAAVVVSGAARPDTAAPADSHPQAGVAPTDRGDAGLFLDVRGPVSADSLAALRRRLQPLRP